MNDNKKILGFLITMSLFLFARSALATDSYCAIGFGTAAANGHYTDNGDDHNTSTSFTNDTSGALLYYFALGNSFRISTDNTYHDSGSAMGYYSDPPLPGTWHVDGGSNPAGTVILGLCPTDLDINTSTPEQVQTNIFNGFILFFIMAFGLIGYYAHRFRRT